MKSSILIAALIAALPAAAVAQASQEELAERKAKKLAEPWLKSADWVLDYADAKAKSKETGKPIFAYFTRSYSP